MKAVQEWHAKAAVGLGGMFWSALGRHRRYETPKRIGILSEGATRGVWRGVSAGGGWRGDDWEKAFEKVADFGLKFDRVFNERMLRVVPYIV